VVLEDGGDDPRLLLKVLENIRESSEINGQLSSKTQEIYERLMRILKSDNCTEIYTFIELINALDLKFNINLK
jgi:DNA-binding phage protein